MTITFLGTAAATSYPLAFCRCEYCSEARIRGGKDLRKRSSIIINDDLLVDLGPDTVAASLQYGKDLTKIQYYLQTHPHSDHFDSSHFSTRIPEYMGIDTPPIQVYASNGSLIRMSEMMKNEGYVSDLLNSTEQKRLNISVTTTEHFKSFTTGAYTIVPFPSNHDDNVDSLLYSISLSGKTILYATDTDALSDDVWSNFHINGLLFNAVIMDHTYGPDHDSGNHLNANRFIEHIERFRRENLLANSCRIFATHISHEGNPNHDEFEKYAHGHGYEVAYDGLVVEL